MKKIIILSCIIGLARVVWGQFSCGYEPSTPYRFASNEYIANGDIFTPHGKIRILYIFIKYGGIYDTLHINGWDNGTFPDWATSINTKAFYNNYYEFSPSLYSDTTRKSVSNFYYQMSKGQFKIIADYYPHIITVDPTSVSSLEEFHKKVIDEIPSSFDWTPYDNRKNNPRFISDNSNSSPDRIADYVVFCHRFSREWPTFPASWLQQITTDGISTTNLSKKYRTPSNDEMYVATGFTHISGALDPIILFPHELGHELYIAPHYAGNNNVCGNYLYEPSAGWGCMRTEYVYPCAAGWERYILDWIQNITANNINSDIMTTSDLSANNGIFILHDFITTGDAIRIKIPPYTSYHQQYLWLENHQGISTFDGNYRYTQFCGTPIDEYHNGLVAYVEIYSSSKANIFPLSDYPNGVRWLSKDGNYDYTFIYDSINPEELCHNTTYPLQKKIFNPIGGQSINEFIRHDFNNDGHISYNSNRNDPHSENEQTEVIKLDNNPPTANTLPAQD